MFSKKPDYEQVKKRYEAFWDRQIIDKWINVYQKIQKAGKDIQLIINIKELPLVFETLRPEGVWLCIDGVNDKYTAYEVLKRITKWA